MIKVPNEYRIQDGVLGSTDKIGNTSAFLIPYQSFTRSVIARDGQGREYVPVSLPNRCPNWREMCFVNDVLWYEEDVVIQYHPQKSAYVNLHVNGLPLWRPMGVESPTPPKALVGSKKVKPRFQVS
jgi:hypothetical protein